MRAVAQTSKHWRPVVLLEQFGVLKVIGEAEPHPHFGKRVKVRCILCKHDDIRVLTQLRSQKRRGARPKCAQCKQTTRSS